MFLWVFWVTCFNVAVSITLYPIIQNWYTSPSHVGCHPYVYPRMEWAILHAFYNHSPDGVARARWRTSGSAYYYYVVHINEVTLHQVRLVLRRVTISFCVCSVSVCDQPLRPTQPPTFSGIENEYRPKDSVAGKQRQVWLISLVDKRVGDR